MKKNGFLLLIVLFYFSGFVMYAQNGPSEQGPTLITQCVSMVEMPSIESQLSSGTFKPEQNIVKEVNPKHWGANAFIPGKGLPQGNDPLWQKQIQVPKTPGRAPILSFDAATATATPTDPTGAVGPNHFINAWNSSFRIWNKSGTALTPAASLGTIFPGTLGDPIVFYDPFADRFLISEFYENGFDVAISKGPNPVTSGWYVYRFATNTFPDYPKFSVWSDGYYITANKDQSTAGTSQVVFALERDKMIAGNAAAQMLGFPLTGIVNDGFYSPLGFNANGPTPPPAGNAPIVYMQDDSWSGVTTDHLKIWKINVNWTTPASSSISSPQILNTTAFDGVFDGGNFVNLPQPSGSDIDALQATIMYMAQYRRFPTYNTVVFNFVVDLNGLDNKAGIRWYELRQTTDGAPWTIFQEGTYAQPNGHSAFSGNMCMDVNGNIALAYTVVSTTQNPSLRYTGRFSSDPPGTMTVAEDVIINGVSVDPASRYGDYSQMTIDPSDGVTFWSIGEYFNSGRRNRVGVFQLAPPPLTAQFTGVPTSICVGGAVTFTDNSIATPTSWTWSFPGGTPSTFSGKVPPPIVYSAAGTYNVTLTVSDGFTTDSEVKTGYITVKNVVADFTATPTSVVVGNQVTFTDNSLCTPLSWTWSFPGGVPSSYIGQTPPPITYNTIGTYSVILVVSNASGSDTKTRTNYITVAPPVFNITNGSITTCSGDFYDTGGPTASYLDNENITETFYPSTAGYMVRFNFNAFSTESGYDFLKIYNGTSTSAPLIGSYDGTTSPGIVTASNASGALTFNFSSDTYLTAPGWSATINCVELVLNPAVFTATTASSTQINLAWTKNASASNVMIVWSPNGTFGAPVNGTTYLAGSVIPGGGTVLYRGGLTAFNHQLLNPGSTHYYKAFSYSGSVSYSAGLTSNATTLCGVNVLPFTNNFDASLFPACWTTQVSGSGTVNKWTISSTTNAGGSASEMKSTYQSVTSGITRLVSPPIKTTGVSPLTLSFKHMLDTYGTGCTLRIQSSTNGTTWTNEAWSLASTASNVGPATVTTTINSNVNSPTTYIAFTIEGNLFQYDYWYIDDISVTNGCTTLYPVSVAVSASGNPVNAGIPVTFTATPVNGGTTPSWQWQLNGANAGTNSNLYTYTPAHGDAVNCILTSNQLCASSNPDTSNTIVMVVNSVPEILTLENVNVPDMQCFDALQTIMVAGNGNYFTVQNGGEATLIAGQNILFYPGTLVEPGGYLYGYIAPSGPWCMAPTMVTTVTGVAESQQLSDPDLFRIYPNPTSGIFTVELIMEEVVETCRVEIMNMRGELIFSKSMMDSKKLEITLNGKPSGIYLVRIISDRFSGISKIVKQD